MRARAASTDRALEFPELGGEVRGLARGRVLLRAALLELLLDGFEAVLRAIGSAPAATPRRAAAG